MTDLIGTGAIRTISDTLVVFVESNGREHSCTLTSGKRKLFDDSAPGDEGEYQYNTIGFLTDWRKKKSGQPEPLHLASEHPPEEKKAEPLTKEDAVWQDEKKQFFGLLTGIKRDGIPELVRYIEQETDFYTAPSSTKYHDAKQGGILHNSLKVYENLITLARVFRSDYTEDSLRIIGLLHDLCKTNFYKMSTRNRKGPSGWQEEPFIDIDDKFPLGHGEKSVILLQRYIKLTDIEIQAIRWHMMAYDDLHYSYAGNIAITAASGKYPIIVLTHIADLSASFLQAGKR